MDVPGIDAWARAALTRLVALPGVRRAGLALVEGGGRRLLFTASDRPSAHASSDPVAWCHIDAFDEVPLNTAVRTAEPVLGTLGELASRYAWLAPEAAGEAADVPGAPDAGALAAVPVVKDGRTVGGFVLWFGWSPPFDDLQREGLSALGRNLGHDLAVRTGDARPAGSPPPETPPEDALAADHVVSPDPSSVGDARHFLRRTLRSWGVDEDTTYTATLCLSEVVTNAVIHTDAPARVSVVLRDGVLTTTVRDQGPGPGRSGHPQPGQPRRRRPGQPRAPAGRPRPRPAGRRRPGERVGLGAGRPLRKPGLVHPRARHRLLSGRAGPCSEPVLSRREQRPLWDDSGVTEGAVQGSRVMRTGAWGRHVREFRAAPTAIRVHLLVCLLLAAVLPVLLRGLDPLPLPQPPWITASVLVTISAINVELGRYLVGGRSDAHQPHKALSAWTFACALLLSLPWLLVVVPLIYVHARWRGLLVPLWKWIGSAAYLVLSGVAAALALHAVLPAGEKLTAGNGGAGFLAMTAATAAFLVVESALFWASALLGHAEDERWLRATLSSPGYYGTELAVVLVGGLFAAVWTAAAWFTVLVFPMYLLAQRAALLGPTRERAELAAVLAERNHDLERANEFKGDLIGMLGHELGNPLTAVIGFSQIGAEALDEQDTTTARESLAVVHRSARQVQTVLGEILAMVSSDGSALTAVPEPCPVAEHLESAVAHRGPQRPIVECPQGLAARVQPGHLDQILGNLLSNADKYAGGATRLAARATGDGHVEILVEDCGPGVREEFRSSLFTRFGRAEEHLGMRGTGLGLFITRELARANGGDVGHREGDPGSVFVLTLPAA